MAVSGGIGWVSQESLRAFSISVSRRTLASAARAPRARPREASVSRPCCKAAAVTRPQRLLEGEFITAGRVVEVDEFRVEPLGVKPPSEPLKSALVLLVRGRP